MQHEYSACHIELSTPPPDVSERRTAGRRQTYTHLAQFLGERLVVSLVLLGFLGLGVADHSRVDQRGHHVHHRGVHVTAEDAAMGSECALLHDYEPMAWVKRGKSQY